MVKEATNAEFSNMLAARGVSRRSFLKLCATIAAAAGLSELAIPRVAQALEDSVIGATEGNLYPVIWMEGASCTGCTESFIKAVDPDAATVILEMISLNYAETVSAAAGYSMEEAKEQTIEAGNYLLIYEGAIPLGWDGNALRVAGIVGTESLKEAAQGANAVIALGSCAVNGGWVSAYPNPSDAEGVQKFLSDEGVDVAVINIPGCPANPEWLTAVLVDVVVMQDADILLDQLNELSMPAFAFNQTVHDNCERRGHFESGEFVYAFGSEEEKLGYCLY
ncbi:MAG: hydrogenase small subunit, partial [Eggerthellaceae bacterium]|nr:hydrogenase small subunit [Eggerthellaceae bacterium]